ncbi:glycine cleavage system aminomethyltransferase GcvT [Myroides odoratimimus]|uniref:glycine cleavage system aminomethyltransferase GcvT n=1 Tax=Myroides odoratimimus TaxID=76832 RepID=UPI0010387A93|nr:glycine cleavage system aminomethyltransferase GcvT [Myroides odoratimimus]MDM1397760.1 glycine cleavage system aminomethyltransferase GcvT [Myroides odoratimimus]QBK76720.1 glycine cleavage system aminomethyltransferase GcvT [Myroides odoratimimus]WHT72131.1 glycine cleavage system aminomethyltransferase GcvT [Myroides odoratimimus]WHU36713.1 glycine cleavage system aminomethyltransferase GcvT [Myroides odoratimimus]
MKQVTLNHIHEALGAKMVPFAGFNMPVQYEGVNIEHETVRNGVGVFDVSHMGIFKISGPNALALIQKVTSNDASVLVDGKAQYCYFPNTSGGVIDDIITYRVNENEYLMVVNASNIEKDWNWVSSHNDMNATLENLSDGYSILAIQGPKAIESMQSLTEVNLADIKFYNFVIDTFAGVKDVVISATGYTGSGGFEVYVKNEDVETVWNKVFEAGANWGIKPIGLAARDTLRLEMGYCLYGNELNDEISPLEAGLGWVTKFTKDFINSDNLKAEKEAGIKNRLIGFELVGKGIPRHDYEIVDAEGNVIGKVTSGTQSPSLGKGIGMGYVPVALAAEGSQIFIRIRKNDVEAKVVKTPFYKK